MEEAKILLKKALTDMQASDILFLNGLYADAVYHAQQAAEKSVKALLSLFGESVKEHRVSDIFYDKIVIRYPELEDVYDKLKELEKHWLKSRYPIQTSQGYFDPLKYYDKERSEKIIKMAREVLRKVMEFLKKELGFELE